MTSLARLAPALALAMLAACHSVRPPAPVPIPAGLSNAQIEDAVTVALRSSRSGRGWKQGSWTIDSIKPGLVLAHIGVERHWMSVSVNYAGSEVVTQILQTRGADDRDPDWAIAWQTHLEDRIAEELKWSARPSQP